MTPLVTRVLAGITLMVILSGCASDRPVLYPNAKYRTYGTAATESAIDYCIEMAENHGVHFYPGEDIARGTVEGGAVGAASGAAVGAVYDNAGRGATAGAVGGAAAGLTRSILRDHKPDATYRRFVEKCLRDHGYEPIGWD